jgi:hypothetical protein
MESYLLYLEIHRCLSTVESLRVINSKWVKIRVCPVLDLRAKNRNRKLLLPTKSVEDGKENTDD